MNDIFNIENNELNEEFVYENWVIFSVNDKGGIKCIDWRCSEPSFLYEVEIDYNEEVVIKDTTMYNKIFKSSFMWVDDGKDYDGNVDGGWEINLVHGCQEIFDFSKFRGV